MQTHNRSNSSIESPHSFQDWNPPDLELELFEEDETVQWGTEREEEGIAEAPVIVEPPQPKPQSGWRKVRPWVIGGTVIGSILFVGVNLGAHALKSLGGIISCGGFFEGNQGAAHFVSIVNQQQQKSFQDKGKWGTSFDALKLSPNDTMSFNHSVSVTPKAAFTFVTPRADATERAYLGLFEWNESALYKLKGYVGAVFVVPDAKAKVKPGQPKPMTTIAISCEASEPGLQFLGRPTLKGNQPVCPKGTVNLNRPSV
ncbi:MAG: type IV pilin-like G/H family protein [Leptolyngbyaceae cyanobacterium bins.59]|nr:type IV pilin-like G/H family protein [Leptolyngbyaceae cyanobacterium bins.59]